MTDRHQYRRPTTSPLSFLLSATASGGVKVVSESPRIICTGLNCAEY